MCFHARFTWFTSAEYACSPRVTLHPGTLVASNSPKNTQTRQIEKAKSSVSASDVTRVSFEILSDE